jgi:(1->4)-alpha-D-glucan 1-alpha-D-glucosylmutase
LSQTLIKCTAPGVPDLYQGTELWDRSLVDPDNRRPVDWEERTAALTEIERLSRSPTAALVSAVRRLFQQAEDGRIKLYLLHRCLGLRRDLPELFELGGYRPLSARGTRQEHAVAYARSRGSATVVVAVARLYWGLTAGGARAPLGEAWEDTAIEAPASVAELRNALTGERVRTQERDGQALLFLGEVFRNLPVAVLTAA